MNYAIGSFSMDNPRETIRVYSRFCNIFSRQVRQCVLDSPTFLLHTCKLEETGTEKESPCCSSNFTAGFSLLETLIAMAILAIGILAIILVFPAAMDRQRLNTLRTMTTTVSQTQLNRLKATGSSEELDTWLTTLQQQPNLNPGSPESFYVKSWVVSSQPYGEINSGLYRITFGLRLWDNRVEYYTTYVADR